MPCHKCTIAMQSGKSVSDANHREDECPMTFKFVAFCKNCGEDQGHTTTKCPLNCQDPECKVRIMHKKHEGEVNWCCCCQLFGHTVKDCRYVKTGVKCSVCGKGHHALACDILCRRPSCKGKPYHEYDLCPEQEAPRPTNMVKQFVVTTKPQQTGSYAQAIKAPTEERQAPPAKTVKKEAPTEERSPTVAKNLTPDQVVMIMLGGIFPYNIIVQLMDCYDKYLDFFGIRIPDGFTPAQKLKMFLEILFQNEAIIETATNILETFSETKAHKFFIDEMNLEIVDLDEENPCLVALSKLMKKFKK